MCSCTKNGLPQAESDEPLCRLIYHMSQDLGRLAEKLLKPFDLTLEQLQILKPLSVEEGMNQRDIGSAVNKTPANMTRILDRLEEKNLVERRSDPTDRRATLVFLTERGKELACEVGKTFDIFSNKFLEGVSDTEQAAIRSAFRKMSANLSLISNNLTDN